MVRKKKQLRIYSALEVANICGVVNQTAINWIKKEYLKAFMTPGGQYRVYADDLVSFLKERNMKIPEEYLTLETCFIDSSILIIDENKNQNNSLKNLILDEFDGISVYQAFDEFEAGHILYENKPRLIILGGNKFGFNVCKLCKKIKTSKILSRSHVVKVSNLDSSSSSKEEYDDLQDYLDAVFYKPFEVEDFLDRIGELASIF